MSTKTDKRLISFLIDDDFINYIINPTDLSPEKWRNYFENHPDQISIANEARHILLGELEFFKLPANEVHEMETSILDKCGLL
ncbi:MAG: hypothetical protein P4L34_02350 [Paludibacter sp.]|nr:hypothetical protein [Paludibacter sp.]